MKKSNVTKANVLYGGNLSQEEVVEKLKQISPTACLNGKKRISAKFGRANIIVKKEKDGYTAYLDESLGVLALLLLASVVFIILLFIGICYFVKPEGNPQGLCIIGGALLYVVLRDIYLSPRKKDLNRFCEQIKKDFPQ